MAAGAPTVGGGCVCCNGLQFKSAIADGVDEVRKSAREQMRQGADHVKIMMSGGVASPYDPLDSLQFSDGEVSAAVEEATAFGRYVCAHAYSAEAITRAARLGVRTIEHGNLIDDAAAKLMAEKGMFLVANLVTYYAMKDRAAKFGMIGESLAKNEIVLQGGLKSLEICKRHGMPVAYGSDLLGELHWDQSRGVHHPAARWCRRSRSSARRPRSAPRCCACRARWERCSQAPLPTASWSTAIR